MHTWSLKEVQRRHRLPGIGVTYGCKIARWSWELKLGPLRVQQGLLTTGPSLWPCALAWNSVCPAFSLPSALLQTHVSTPRGMAILLSLKKCIAMETRVAFNSKSSSCAYLPSAEIAGICHHTEMDIFTRCPRSLGLPQQDPAHPGSHSPLLLCKCLSKERVVLG